MQVKIYTRSETFRNFIRGVFTEDPIFGGDLPASGLDASAITFVHLTSYGAAVQDWLKQHLSADHSVAVCSDRPHIKEMLDYAQMGAKGYCNSFMQGTHYQHMLRLLSNGQSWYPPHLLQQTFTLAHRAVSGNDVDASLAGLTTREKQVAQSVSKGLSNRQIADQYKISERTVKTHLTNIFKKLQIKDRVGLVLHLKQPQLD